MKKTLLLILLGALLLGGGWYGFKIKSKEPKFKPKAHSITFTQIKQIQKNQKKKSCYKGMFWRMNTQSDGLTWMAVTKENGEKV